MEPFAQVLVAELRQLERRLAAAHAAACSGLAPPPRLQPAEGASAPTAAAPALDLPEMPHELQVCASWGSPRQDDGEPRVPCSRTTPLAGWDAGQWKGSGGPHVALGGEPQDGAWWPAEAAPRAGASRPPELVAVGGAADRFSEMWWHFASQLMSFGDHPVLRKCWVDEGESPVARLSNAAAAGPCEDQEGDLVSTTWRAMNRMQLARLSTRRLQGAPRLQRSCETGRFVLHPYSWKRLAWILLGFAFLGFDIFCLTMDQFMLLGNDVKSAVQSVAAVYWTLDMLLSFVTGVFNYSQLEMRLWKIARHYAMTWFFFDAALVALQWLTQFSDGELSSAQAGALKYVRILKYLRLLRFVKFDHFLTSILAKVNSVSAILALRIGQYLTSVLFFVHASACAWYSLGVSSDDGWAFQRDSIRVWPVNYLISLHWAAANLQGQADVGPGDVADERAFAVCHIILSVIVLALFLSKLCNEMAVMQEISTALNRQSSAARHFCKRHGIPTALAVRVQRWFKRHQVMDAKRQRGVEEEEFMQMLPTDLRRALLHESRLPLLIKHEVFHACNNSNARFFERLTCDTFTPVTHLPEDEVFSYGMVCSHMYFVAAGQSVYLKYAAVLRALMQSVMILRGQPRSRVRDNHKESRSDFLPQGTALCEAVLWIHWVHVGDFASVSSLSLLVLDLQRFEALVTAYPNVQASLQSHAQRFMTAVRASEDPSDLFNTGKALHLLNKG